MNEYKYEINPACTFFIPLENTPCEALLLSGLYSANTGFNCEFSNGIYLLREVGRTKNHKNDKIMQSRRRC